MATRSLAAPGLALWLTAAVGAQAGWQQRFPGQSPPVRGYHNLVFDVAHNQTVLFGGWANSLYLGDTWQWDGATWTQSTPAVAPSPRLAHAMAYDLGRGRVVVFGGAVGGGAGVDDDQTWEWDGAQWQQLQPTVSPSPRRAANMTYDVGRGVCVLFGGGFTATGSPVYDDTWEWNGTAWSQPLPATSPPARWACCLAADWVHGNVVMFGGSAGAVTTSMEDTWTWDGTAWLQRTPTFVPPARRSAGAAFDVRRGVVVISGGLGTTPNPYLDSTCLWDGSDWRPDPRVPAPGARMSFALANDFVRDGTVLFGGYSGIVSGDTWEYTAGTLATWQPIGSGCAGAAGTPVLAPAPGSLPIAGTTFTMRLTYGTSNNAAVLAVGVSDQQWLGGALPASLAPLGMIGCTLHVSPDLLVFAPLTNGTSNVAWPLPSTPAALGFAFFSQGLVFEPGVNPFGAIVSAGAAGTVGAF